MSANLDHPTCRSSPQSWSSTTTRTVITAHALTTEVESARATGCDAVISKPLDMASQRASESEGVGGVDGTRAKRRESGAMPEDVAPQRASESEGVGGSTGLVPSAARAARCLRTSPRNERARARELAGSTGLEPAAS